MGKTYSTEVKENTIYVHKRCMDCNGNDKGHPAHKCYCIVPRWRGWICDWCGDHVNVYPVKKCKGCKMVFYCSRSHQKRDWNVTHRYQCEKFQQKEMIFDMLYPIVYGNVVIILSYCFKKV